VSRSSNGDGQLGEDRHRGVIGIFARHPTAANLLMALMILGGLLAHNRLNTQFFPDFGIDWISVSVVWPGASAEDADAKIVQAIEPEVRFLDGVKKVISTSWEDSATVAIEFDPGSDMQKALSDVETAVSQVTTLPEDSETPLIRRAVRYDTIARLVISGPFPDPALKSFAKSIRDGLLARGIDRVTLVGTRDEEIWVEVQPEILRRLDLTLSKIGQRIADTSHDLPAGETGGKTVQQIRSLGLARNAEAVGAIAVRALENGETIFVRDIAAVSEQFEKGGETVSRDGQPAVELRIARAANADALDSAEIVDAYLRELQSTLPANLRIEKYDVAANMITERINLLLRNGLTGLVLVVAILFIFLNANVAFWVAAGIPVALAATLIVMWATDQSINMVSLFGMIMGIGIVVDDAIVVGEHAAARHLGGLSPLEAAEQGARRMSAPVMSSSLTTMAAFTPLFIISDAIGQIIAAIPMVVVAMIAASLVECFLVLPGHLRGALHRRRTDSSRARQWINSRFDRFRDGPFRRAVSFCLHWRYATVATATAGFILVIGMILGGRIDFLFFASPEAERVYANVKFAAGTPREQTQAMINEMARALMVTESQLTKGQHNLVKISVARVGGGVGERSGPVGTAKGDNVGGIIVELTPSDVRTVRTQDFIAHWRNKVRLMAGIDTFTIIPAIGGPPGRDIDVRLSGADPVALKRAAAEVSELLRRYPGVTDIEDDLPYGKEETIFAVNTRGRTLGFDSASLGCQLRNAFEGAIPLRFARDNEEVTVRVKFPEGWNDIAALNSLYLRSENGVEVPLEEIVDRRESRGFSRIKREDGAREVAITAHIEKSVTTTDKILSALQRDGLAGIAERGGLTYSFAGKAEEQAQTFGDMRVGAMAGLAAIYIILAWVFGNYMRPFVVISLVPLALIGVALGHWLLGFQLTILSLIAMIGLSGIVINDSIILVSTIDEKLAAGNELMAAIVDGARDRLRAVILTSATTIGGLTPMLFETSLQARFLVPMAVTIIFGLLVTTLLVLFVVPALLAIQHDIGRLFRHRAEPATWTDVA
jgi:multidrug efflux pump subunit AcrB